MAEFLTIIVITILAAVSPGADFAIVTKNSYLHGRSVGIMTAIGIGLGVLVHVAYTLVAVAVVMNYAPDFFTVIKFVGAAYLIYIGYKTFTQKPVDTSGSCPEITSLQALRYGFFCNVTNPKTMLFVISTYTQIVSAATPEFILVGYGVFMSFTHFIWFVLVTLLFSQVSLRQKMLDKQVAINRFIGVILGMLGGSLLFTSIV